MKVKKFVASTMPEAMKKVRAELGQDAVILNSKVVQKGGFFGFFTRKSIEVIAAIDERPSENRAQKKEAIPIPKQHDAWRDAQQAYTPPKKEKRINSDEIVAEIQELKEMLKNTQKGSYNISGYPPSIQTIIHTLQDQEFEDEICQSLVTVLLEKWYSNKENISDYDVEEWVKEELVNRISNFEFGGLTYRKQFVNIVGPTGVGKTTTIAKIAAQSVLKDNKTVAFITTDTYRIAAIEQLKTYAKILNVPLEVSYTIDDFKKAKEKFSSYDLVLVDTAGRNFRNKKFIDDLRSVIDFSEEIETYLVLALTSKYNDMKKIFEQFSVIDIDKLIFTKVDETSQFGAMINLMLTHKVGVAYLTNGQNVPDDIEEATPKAIVNTIFEVEKNERSS